MAVNVTKMNVEDDQSGACLKDPGEMSWHKISLLTAVAITTTTLSCINSKYFAGTIAGAIIFSEINLKSCGLHANMNFCSSLSSV